MDAVGCRPASVMKLRKAQQRQWRGKRESIVGLPCTCREARRLLGGLPELLMAQFTPCKEKNPHARTTHPLLVGGQADLLLDNVQITVVIDNPSVLGKES
jgi:hypothetical protein